MSRNKIKGNFFCSMSLLAAVSSFSAVAAETKTIKINKVAYEKAESSLSLDTAMRLKKFFLFPSIDDVGGVLSPVLDGELAEAVSSYTRFSVVRDAEILKALNSGEQSYQKVARSESVHKEAIKAANADASILLSARTLGGNLELMIEVRDQGGSTLLSETRRIPAFSSKDARAKQIADLFSVIIEKIPFKGTVTGRSGKTITLDLGRGSVRVGDEVDIIRLVSIQRHPLLKTMVGADYSQVGRARITSVDKVLSFADVLEERPGESIASDNKIISVRERSGSEQPSTDQADWVKKTDEHYSVKQRGEEVAPRLAGDLDQNTPQFGYASADLSYGSLSHQHSTGGTPVEATGSGLGAGLGAELWVTRNWILGGGIQLQGANLSTSNTSLGSASWTKFQFFGGYRLIPGKLDELSILFAAGVGSLKVGLPNNTTEGTGPRSYSGILFKAAGDVMIMPKNKIWIGVEIIPFGTFEETGSGFGSASTANVVGLNLDWVREMFPNLWGRLGIKVELANASITGGGTNSDKRFVFGPGVLYYF